VFRTLAPITTGTQSLEVGRLVGTSQAHREDVVDFQLDLRFTTATHQTGEVKGELDGIPLSGGEVPAILPQLNPPPMIADKEFYWITLVIATVLLALTMKATMAGPAVGPRDTAALTKTCCNATTALASLPFAGLGGFGVTRGTASAFGVFPRVATPSAKSLSFPFLALGFRGLVGSFETDLPLFRSGVVQDPFLFPARRTPDLAGNVPCTTATRADAGRSLVRPPGSAVSLDVSSDKRSSWLRDFFARQPFASALLDGFCVTLAAFAGLGGAARTLHASWLAGMAARGAESCFAPLGAALAAVGVGIVGLMLALVAVWRRLIVSHDSFLMREGKGLWSGTVGR
jgi:hypothetical protein